MIQSETNQIQTTNENSVNNSLQQQYIEEYKSLRLELIKRLDIQHHLLLFSLIIASVLFTLGLHYQVNNAFILLLYPILAMFLAVAWVYNDVRLNDIRAYIRARIEKKRLEGLEWENHLAFKRHGSFLRLSELSALGIFVVLSILAIVISRLRSFAFDNVDTLLFYSGIFAIIVSINLIFFRRFQIARKSNHSLSVEMDSERF